jgi:hypothetical protein
MERPNFDQAPLGDSPKGVRISHAEMHLAYLHRQATGEPIQTWIRRLIRENAHKKGSERLSEPPPRLLEEQAAFGGIQERREARPTSADPILGERNARWPDDAQRTTAMSSQSPVSRVGERVGLELAYHVYVESFVQFPSKGYAVGATNGFVAGWDAHRAAMRAQVQQWRARAAGETGAAGELFLTIAAVLEEALTKAE